MTDEREDRLKELLVHDYHTPPPTPRDEMWAVIEPGMQSPRVPSAVLLERARAVRFAGRSRFSGRSPLVGWAVAAAATLVLGIGIGRWTAPGGPMPTAGPAAPSARAVAVRTAAAEHLTDTESLLTLVRADARAGRLDPELGASARGLLLQTRLLLDALDPLDPALRDLLEDLESVLVQVVVAADVGSGDPRRMAEELQLTLEGMEDSQVLARIEAVAPKVPGLQGT